MQARLINTHVDYSCGRQVTPAGSYSYQELKNTNIKKISSMAIKFKAVKTVNPSDMEGPRQYYARAVVSNDVSLRELAKEISEGCSLSKNVCTAYWRT